MSRTPSATPPAMTSSRPYLIRALYQWISDNGLTPYLLVDAAADGLRVPPQAVKDGRVVLNVAARAVANLELADDVISFQARFNGVPMLVLVPVGAVLAVYAMENGQGMVLPPDPGVEAAPADSAGEMPPLQGVPAPAAADSGTGDPRVAGDAPPPASGDGQPPATRRNHLRLIK